MQDVVDETAGLAVVRGGQKHGVRQVHGRGAAKLWRRPRKPPAVAPGARFHGEIIHDRDLWAQAARDHHGHRRCGGES